MFSGAGAAGSRAWRSFHAKPRSPLHCMSRRPSAPRVLYSSAAAIGPALSAASRWAGGAVLGGTGVLALQANTGRSNDDTPHPCQTVAWVKQLASTSEEVLNPGQMLRSNPLTKLIVAQDHLFEAMVASTQVHEFRCFYESSARRFHSVVQLGRDVCGFPATVHGGLTAAIVDETFGGLGVCLWRSGALGARLPAYTARLEVDYKQKIPAGSLILVSTEVESVEGRKVWMRATVTDGQDAVYASARALFVAPRMPGEGLIQAVGQRAAAVGGWAAGLFGRKK